MPGEVRLVKAEPGVAAKGKVKSEPLPPIPKPDAVPMAKKLKRLRRVKVICQVCTRSAKPNKKSVNCFYNTYSPDPSVSSKGIQKVHREAWMAYKGGSGRKQGDPALKPSVCGVM